MGTVLLSFNKNSNIGLYGFVTNNYALVGREVDVKCVEEIKRILKVPVHQVNIAGTSLLGVFLVGNDDILLVPGIAFNHELERLEELGIRYKVFETELTCLGNNMVVNENGAVISKDFSEKDVTTLRKLLDLPVKKVHIADTSTPGSCIVINGEKGLVHKDISSEEIKLIEDILKIELLLGTVNMGSPYIKSGILCNDKGMIIGESSGPAEIMNAEEALGFIDG